MVDKEKFVAFMVEVINCTAQTDSKTVRIKIIIKAEEKYLEVEGMTPEAINEILRAEGTDRQASDGTVI